MWTLVYDFFGRGFLQKIHKFLFLIAIARKKQCDCWKMVKFPVTSQSIKYMALAAVTAIGLPFVPLNYPASQRCLLRC